MSDTSEFWDAESNASADSSASSADHTYNNQAAPTSRRRAGGLSGMLLPELQQLAASLGINGTARMRKSQLIEAINDKQRGGSVERDERPAAAAAAQRDRTVATSRLPLDDGLGSGAGGAGLVTAPFGDQGAGTAPSGDPGAGGDGDHADRDRADRDRGADSRADRDSERTDNRAGRGDRDRSGGNRDRSGNNRDRSAGERSAGDRPASERDSSGDADTRGDREDSRAADRGGDGDRSRDRDDDWDNRRGRRGRRYRDRNRRRRDGDSGEPEVTEDDVLIPVAGILDVLDNYAFVRTSGYLPGPNDVYVSLAQVRRHGLRKGDAITGAVRQPRDGERREKFNALVRLDTINGAEPEQARTRVEFTKLTPLYPQDRMRLETEPGGLTTRVIDLVAPIGKGQRGLIVSPPKAGKTMVLQAIANAITSNNPECHLMVVLVDERPEEVTDMQRSVKGEVIASTFDRPAEDHTTVAELAIERAKRLVELGHDVVVLLDSITRLGRAYNLAAPASGRILSGGVDSTALYPPKRFFGAARNIEHGGSLTILATALVETGSRMDEVIFEEFKGTGNMKLKLDRKLSDKRIFPAVDVDASSTRKEEILLSREELQVVWKLRRVLSALEDQQAIELLLDRLRKTRTNVEFLMQVQKTTPMPENGMSSAED
ncbi:MAG TPA: transcription termination factor Rho [Actinomycetes bacterium]|nr:transcription termination factor Rho [Actinomycetes bacterium]